MTTALKSVPNALTDQTGHDVVLTMPAQRIVSLVPSQTELLFALGAGDQVVGCTRYCLHPRAARERSTVIGGSKRYDVDAIRALEPDLILANKEENDRETIVALRAAYPTWVSDIATFPEALTMISAVGQLCGAEARASALRAELQAEWSQLTDFDGVSVAYLIWRKPFMAVGAQTFIDDVLQRLGLVNVFTDSERYPECTLAEIAARKPDVVLLSSEPYPFSEKHIAEVRQVLPSAAVRLVDGEMFSWYGSRLRLAPAYFASLQPLYGANAAAGANSP